MKNTEPQVIGLGALNVDHIYRVKRILIDGEAPVKEANSFPGGSAANTIYGLAKLGVNTGFVGAVGNDEDGKLLLRSFQNAGVATSGIKTIAGVRSGAGLCLTDDLNRRSLYISPGANDLLSEKDVAVVYVNHCQFLHVTSFVDNRQFKMTLKLLDRLSPAVKISFSPGNIYTSKGIDTLSPIIARSHVLFVNYEELHELTSKGMAAGSKQFLDMGCRIVAVTMGKGRKIGKTNAVCYIRSQDGEFAIERIKTRGMKVVDSTGAGDAFATGFLFGLIKGKTIDVCGQLGDLVARFCLTRPGAREGLPGFSELQKRYQQIYDKVL
ncbi:MAG: PfkB family carbohydrate kinase [Dehalococcoidales bacterium]|nr:PfkB family carbohydrate kinase [Dehalococcoidales bacterium]